MVSAFIVLIPFFLSVSTDYLTFFKELFTEEFLKGFVEGLLEIFYGIQESVLFFLKKTPDRSYSDPCGFCRVIRPITLILYIAVSYLWCFLKWVLLLEWVLLSELPHIGYLQLTILLLFITNTSYTKTTYYRNFDSYHLYSHYLFNKFLIKCLVDFITEMRLYKYLTVILNLFFKWAPLFKRTSYFGLYNFSKNK